MIMYQLKPFKHYIHYRNETSKIGKVCEQKIYYQIQTIILFDLNDGNVMESAVSSLLSSISPSVFIPTLANYITTLRYKYLDKYPKIYANYTSSSR